MSRTVLTTEELLRQAGALHPAWVATTESLARTVEFGSFPTAVRFISELAPVAERLQHHPDLRLSWRTVELQLSTHSAGGVTGLDIELAGELDRIIERLG